MFLQQSFTPGTYVTVVPVGIPVTLQYNAKGILQTAYLGYSSDKEEMRNGLFNTLYESKCVPVKVPSCNGTILVEGVLYTSKFFPSDNEYEHIGRTILCTYYIENFSNFNFFAGHVYSTGISFNGASSCRKWLSLSKFKLLPGFLVPGNPTRESIESCINGMNQYPFVYPLIMYFIVYDRNSVSFNPTGIKELMVSKIEPYTDENGYFMCKISNSIGNTIYCDYSEAVTCDIRNTSCIVVDKNDTILYSYEISRKKLSLFDKSNSESLPGSFSCPVCGRQIVIPTSGPVMCSNLHCMSRQYSEFLHFLEYYNLPKLSFAEYKDRVHHKELHWLPDIFLLDAYRDYKIKTTLYDLLISLIPIRLHINKDIVSSFVQHCNNNLNMFTYYIKNPSKIQIDFHLVGKGLDRFVQWLSDNYNIDLISALLDLDNIELTRSGKKFDGAPIFRGKTILITGDFKHGSQDDIIGILQSYSAKVVTSFDDSVQCLIVGSSQENVNGVYIRKCKSKGIPVFDEYQFFKEYDIDVDLINNSVEV